MGMLLLDTVKSLLAELESLTGKPVEYRENEHLPVAANLAVAAEGRPAHVLSYRRGAGPVANHIIANECGHLLRMLCARDESRRVPVANQQTMIQFLEEMKNEIEEIALTLGTEKVRQLIIVWYDGIVFQVTRMPTDIAVETWLYERFPEFRPVQMKAILEQRETAVLSLSDRIRKVTPQKIFDASHLMNYAYFRLMGDLFGVNYVNPYTGTLYREKGEGLVKITLENRGEDNHEEDVRLVDQWSSYLHLGSCYEWRPYGTAMDRRVH